MNIFPLVNKINNILTMEINVPDKTRKRNQEVKRIYYEKNGDHLRRYERNYYERNKEKILAKAKEKRDSDSQKKPRGRPRKYPDDTPQPNTAD